MIGDVTVHHCRPVGEPTLNNPGSILLAALHHYRLVRGHDIPDGLVAFGPVGGPVIPVGTGLTQGLAFSHAVAESFFHTLKTRLIYHLKYRTTEELIKDFW